MLCAMDSQAKYATVALGVVALYLRLSAYQENIWDHAAGTLVVQEAGGIVTDRHGKELDFGGGGCKLVRNSGVVVTNGRALHEKVLQHLAQTQKEETMITHEMQE